MAAYALHSTGIAYESDNFNFLLSRLSGWSCVARKKWIVQKLIQTHHCVTDTTFSDYLSNRRYSFRSNQLHLSIIANINSSSIFFLNRYIKLCCKSTLVQFGFVHVFCLSSRHRPALLSLMIVSLALLNTPRRSIPQTLLPT